MGLKGTQYYGMVWLVWLWHPVSDIVQKIEEPKCLTRGIKEVEELKEILSDAMLKTSEGSCPRPLKVSKCMGVFLM